MVNLFLKLNKIIDALILGVLWLIFSIPIFTMGAANSALYYTYHKSIRQERSYVAREFLHAFKDNFKNSTIIWLVFLLVFGIQTCTYLMMSELSTTTQIPLLVVILYTLGSIFFIQFGIYVFPYQGRFNDKLSIILKNSALLMIAKYGWSLILLILLAIAVIGAICIPMAVPAFIAIYTWLSNLILERIFRKIMPEEDLQREIELDR